MNKTLTREIMENAIRLHDMMESVAILEGDIDRTDEVKELMKNPENWIRDDYDQFIESLNKSKRKCFLTMYTPEEFERDGVSTYQLRGFSIGYALKPMPDGNVDIISVHNNEPDVHNIGDLMLSLAKANGGTQLDHFDGKLSDIYSRNGFEEYDRWKFNDEMAPGDWNYEKYGRPDIVLRRIKKGGIDEWVIKMKNFQRRLDFID